MNDKLINEINSQFKLVELKFFDKYCKECIANKLLLKNGCAKTSGHKFLCCRKKEIYMKRNLRTFKDSIMKEFIMDILEMNEEKNRE